MPKLLKYKHKKNVAMKIVVELQEELFVMTVDAVYEELTQQKIWKIDETVRKKFNSKCFYKVVLKHDIGCKQWQIFIREQIINYLYKNNMVNIQQIDDEVIVFLKYYKLQQYEISLRNVGLENLNDLKLLDNDSILSIAKEVQMKTKDI
eukprot:456227_1